MYSPTEERLRTFVEKLSEALTEEAQVIVRPGDSWAAYPKNKPPLLTFRLADVATIGDAILAVTAHEIAHLLYTDIPIKWRFDVSKKPRAAHLLLNAVEDSRIERVFSENFPGAQSLFDHLKEETYDYKVQRGFNDLPIKWRYVLNIDRVLHGLEPWGDQRDLEAVDKALERCLDAMWASTTQKAADKLRVPYRIMLELMRQEADEGKGKKKPLGQTIYIPPELLEDFGLPTDYETNAPMDDEDELEERSGAVSDHAGPGAKADDHKVGGQDGTQGKRAKADGTGLQGPGGKDQSSGGSNEEGEGDAEGSGGSGGGAVADDSQTKPTNIVEEMVAEEKGKGSRNKTIDILSYRQRHRAREAKEIEKKIRSEQDAFWDELNKLWRQQKGSGSFHKRMRDNDERYRRDRAAMSREIATLRGYARNVLRDNDTQRFAGNYTSGRKIKKHRLARMQVDDPRLFQRKEETGGKSYDIVVVVDQSTSMNAGGKQELAYKACLVFVEAFDGLVGTSVVGFSDLGYDDRPDTQLIAQLASRGVSHSYAARHARHSIMHRTYKAMDDDLRRRWCTIPELAVSFASTPMHAGVEAAVEQLTHSRAQVKAIVIITDGQPNSEPDALAAFRLAQRRGIETYALHIGGRYGSYGDDLRDAGFGFLTRACDRSVQVHGTAGIPQAVYRLLRGVVRNRRGAA